MSDNSPPDPITAEQAREAQATARAYDFFRQWWFSLLVMLVICATALLSREAVEQLALQRHWVSNGEWWRIFTSQYVHLNINHTLLNIVGYLIIAAAFREDVSPREEACALLLANLGVAAGMYFFSLGDDWYVGLSGAIYGLLTHNLIVGWQRSPAISVLFVLFLAGKFYYEQFVSGPDTVVASLIEGDVAVDSHLYGAITGLLTGLASYFLFHRHHVIHAANTRPDNAA